MPSRLTRFSPGSRASWIRAIRSGHLKSSQFVPRRTQHRNTTPTKPTDLPVPRVCQPRCLRISGPHAWRTSCDRFAFTSVLSPETCCEDENAPLGAMKNPSSPASAPSDQRSTDPESSGLGGGTLRKAGRKIVMDHAAHLCNSIDSHLTCPARKSRTLKAMVLTIQLSAAKHLQLSCQFWRLQPVATNPRGRDLLRILPIPSICTLSIVVFHNSQSDRC